MKWIKELKVGDAILQIERHPTIPDGKWLWNATVVAIESNYIETSFERDRSLEWLTKLTEKLITSHRTYERTWIKNYYGIDGTIDVEQSHQNENQPNMKTELEWCISVTNRVLKRWKSGRSSLLITKEDVKGLLLGYIRKKLLINCPRGHLKEVNRRLHIAYLGDSIVSVDLTVDDLLAYSPGRYDSPLNNKLILMSAALNQIDFKSLESGEVPEESELAPELEAGVAISFQTIENIKF